MLDRVKSSLLSALLTTIGAILARLVKGVYQGADLSQFLGLEFVFAFVFHLLLTLFLETRKTKKQ